MCEERIDLTLASSPLDAYLASIGLQDEVLKAELNLDDLPPVKHDDLLEAHNSLIDLPLPWESKNDILEELQSLALKRRLIPSDAMSLLQLRYVSLNAAPYLEKRARSYMAIIPILALAAYCFLSSIVSILVLLAGAVAVARSFRIVPVRVPLIASFDALCKKEVQRHEKLYQFLRRVQELEQLERGFRFSAPSSTSHSPLPAGSSPYLGVLQHSARLALQSCATELQCACAFLNRAAGDQHRHLLPPVKPICLDPSEESTSHVLRQWAQQVCAARANWIQCLIVVAATNPTLLLRHWASVWNPTRALEEMQGLLDVEAYLEVRRKHEAQPVAATKLGLIREFGLLRQQLRSVVALTAAAEEAVYGGSEATPRITRLGEELAYAGALLMQIQTYLAPPVPKTVRVPAGGSAGPKADTEVYEASGVAEKDDDDDEEREEERVARMTTVAREMASLLTGKPAAAGTAMPVVITAAAPRTKSSTMRQQVQLAHNAASQDSDSDEQEAPPSPPTHLFAELRNVLTHRKTTGMATEEQFGSD